MKNTITKSIRAALFTSALATLSTHAQVVETIETKTVTSLGTVTEWGPGRVLLKTESSPEPIRYTFSEATTYVDEAGNPVSVANMKPGLPVTVYYTRSGDAMIASKVIIRTGAATPTPAPGTTQIMTKSLGTISEFGTDRILLKTEVATDPTRYTYSKTTTYVDETGAPVSIETVKSGLPVTVYYTKVGDSMIVSKMVVRKVVPAPAVPPVIETKRTTTTTETKRD